MFVNRLTVNGQDFFLPDPVDQLRDAILQAIRSGGGYVTIASPRLPAGVDVLFSTGMSVTWSRSEVSDEPSAAGPPLDLDFIEF